MKLFRGHLRESFALAVLPLYALSVQSASAGQVPSKAAQERCTLATEIARRIVSLRDFERKWLGAQSDRLNLLVSLKSDRHSRGPEALLLKANDSCAGLTIDHSYGVPGSVRVALGRGSEKDLEPEALFDVVRLRTSGPSRWGVSWNKTDSVSNCPKGKACLGASRMLLPLPTWRATIARSSNGTFAVISSILEFVPKQSRSADPRAGIALGDLPHDAQCGVLRKMAGEIVKAVDYSEWYALPKGPIVMRFAPWRDASELGASPPSRDAPCDDMNVHHFYGPGAAVAARMATKNDVAKGAFAFNVNVRSLSKGRWELSWTMDKRLWACPDRKDDHYVGGCLDPGSEQIPAPILRVFLVQTEDGMALEASWLDVRSLTPTMTSP